MAGIKSINELKPPLNPDVNVPKIATQAVADPARKMTTVFTAEKIVGLMIFNNRLLVATENGVYAQDDRDAIFKRLEFEIVEEENE